MKTARVPVFREARRGDEPDEILLVDGDGLVLIVRAHGIGPDENVRTREAVLRLLKSAATRGQE